MAQITIRKPEVLTTPIDEIGIGDFFSWKMPMLSKPDERSLILRVGRGLGYDMCNADFVNLEKDIDSKCVVYRVEVTGIEARYLVE